MAPNPEYTIKVLRSGDFDERFLSAWEELEGRAMEPNGYLSPHFVIPAIKFITNKDNLLGIIVEKTNRGGILYFQEWGYSTQARLRNISPSHIWKHSPAGTPFFQAF